MTVFSLSSMVPLFVRISSGYLQQQTAPDVSSAHRGELRLTGCDGGRLHSLTSDGKQSDGGMPKSERDATLTRSTRPPG